MVGVGGGGNVSGRFWWWLIAGAKGREGAQGGGARPRKVAWGERGGRGEHGVTQGGSAARCSRVGLTSSRRAGRLGGGGRKKARGALVGNLIESSNLDLPTQKEKMSINADTHHNILSCLFDGAYHTLINPLDRASRSLVASMDYSRSPTQKSTHDADRRAAQSAPVRSRVDSSQNLDRGRWGSRGGSLYCDGLGGQPPHSGQGKIAGVGASASKQQQAGHMMMSRRPT